MTTEPCGQEPGPPRSYVIGRKDIFRGPQPEEVDCGVYDDLSAAREDASHENRRYHPECPRVAVYELVEVPDTL